MKHSSWRKNFFWASRKPATLRPLCHRCIFSQLPDLPHLVWSGGRQASSTNLELETKLPWNSWTRTDSPLLQNYECGACVFFKWANLTSTYKSHIWPYLVITWGPLIGTTYWQAGSGLVYSFHIYLPYHHYKVNSRCESKGALLCVYRRGTDGLAGLPHVSVSPPQFS